MARISRDRRLHGQKSRSGFGIRSRPGYLVGHAVVVPGDEGQPVKFIMQAAGIQFSIQGILNGPARLVELILRHKNKSEIAVPNYIIEVLLDALSVEFDRILVTTQEGENVCQISEQDHVPRIAVEPLTVDADL